jgi:hypothetical protein
MGQIRYGVYFFTGAGKRVPHYLTKFGHTWLVPKPFLQSISGSWVEALLGWPEALLGWPEALLAELKCYWDPKRSELNWSVIGLSWSVIGMIWSVIGWAEALLVELKRYWVELKRYWLSWSVIGMVWSVIGWTEALLGWAEALLESKTIWGDLWILSWSVMELRVRSCVRVSVLICS